MLSKIIVGSAGFEKKGKGEYYPRPSSAGPERCIRQMVYHARKIPEDSQMGDRFVIVLGDGSFHEELTADWLRTTTFQLSSQQMALDIQKLDFLPEPDAPDSFPFKSWRIACIDYQEEHHTISDEWQRKWISHGWKWCKDCERAIPLNILHGHTDGVLTDLFRIDRGYEHKGINHFQCERYWRGVWPLDHITQTCLYTKGLRLFNPEINEAVLLIKNKNTSQYMDLVIRYDEDTDTAIIVEKEKSSGEVEVMKDKPLAEFRNIVGDAIAKFERVHEHALAGTLPDRPFDVGTDYPCSYCSWQETCWEGYGEEFKRLTKDKALEEEWYHLCKYYLEVAMHYKNAEEEYESLRKDILDTLKGEGARSGRIGPYAVKIMTRKSKKGQSEFIQITIPKRKGKR